MKKILIFGAGGMIGHQMYRQFLNTNFTILGTLKQPLKNYDQFNLFKSQQIKDHFDIFDFDRVQNLLNEFKPDIILNCIGITLRKPEIKDLEYTKKINSDFPQLLNIWCKKNNANLIHFSTDCVFSGKRGPYTEESLPDATDVYGITKAQGEVVGSNSLTLRGSMIGRELFGKTELLEWALSQKNNTIKGFSKAYYSGVTTSVMSELVAKIVSNENILTGLYQVSGASISKYDLLQLINTEFLLNMTLEKNESYSTEKILISQKITEKMGFYCSPWPVMIQNLSKDLFKY